MIKVTIPSTPSVVVESSNTQSTVKLKSTPSIAVIPIEPVRQVVNFTSIGPPGPPGRDGISEDEMVYAKRTDFVGENIIYRGEAVVGSPTSSSVWRIRRITIGVDGDVTEEWVEGSSNFSFVWNDRTTYNFN